MGVAKNERQISECGTGRRHALRTIVVGGAAGAALLIGGGATGVTRAAADEPVRPTPPATPDEALAALKAGNERYVNHKPQVRETDDIEEIWTSLAGGQAPFATVLGCADSRLAPEIIFDQSLGAIFVAREAGNRSHAP